MLSNVLASALIHRLGIRDSGTSNMKMLKIHAQGTPTFLNTAQIVFLMAVKDEPKIPYKTLFCLGYRADGTMNILGADETPEQVLEMMLALG